MRRIFLVLAIVLWAMAGATCGGTTFFALATFEPPHPDMTVPIDPVPAHAINENIGPLQRGGYYLWVYPEDDECTLEVTRSEGGKSLGRTDGRKCTLSLTAAQGDVWKVHATSKAPGSAVTYVGHDDGLFRAPFSYGAMGAGGLFGVGALFAILAMVTRRRDDVARS